MKLYTESRKAIFKIHKGEWDNVEEEVIVIGETDDGYITRIIETSIPYWDQYGRYEAHMCLPLCIHKSRFVKWCSIQMEIFKK